MTVGQNSPAPLNLRIGILSYLITNSVSQKNPQILPFNPSTSIQYTISNREFETLKIYNILSDEVATLVNEEKPGGVYEVNFNASNLSSGIYFYSLTSGAFTETKKMILLR